MKHDVKVLVLFLLLFLFTAITSGCYPLFDDTATSYDQDETPAAESSDESWESGLVTETEHGTVIGFIDTYDTLAWLGIPYAKPPKSDLRWRAPRDPDPWDEPIETIDFQGPCPQICGLLSMDKENLGNPMGDEDCLYLNVWRPNTNEILPVYVWIHGGGNSIGGTKDFNGSYFAEKANAIFVSIAYRLGPFGWFKHPSLEEELTEENKNTTEKDNSGNYGTLDIIKALEWVRDNISQFGGDPDNVTVAGQSGGGTNVFSLLVSPLVTYTENSEDKHLFHKAISQSGRLQTYTQEEAEEGANYVLSKLLMNDNLFSDKESADEFIHNPENSAWIAAYLKERPADDILMHGYETYLAGMIDFPRLIEDGHVIVNNAKDVFKNGLYHQVPMIIGATKDEAKLGVAAYLGKLSEPELIDVILAYNPENPTIDIYDLVAAPRLYEATSNIASKVMRMFLLNKLVKTISQYQDVFVYDFTWDNEPEPFNQFLGACHALDIPFLLGNFFTDDHYLRIAWCEDNKAEVMALSEAMVAYWKNFMRTGDPNGDGLVTWEAWSNTLCGRKRIIFDTDIHMSGIF